MSPLALIPWVGKKISVEVPPYQFEGTLLAVFGNNAILSSGLTFSINHTTEVRPWVPPAPRTPAPRSGKIKISLSDLDLGI